MDSSSTKPDQLCADLHVTQHRSEPSLLADPRDQLLLAKLEDCVDAPVSDGQVCKRCLMQVSWQWHLAPATVMCC